MRPIILLLAFLCLAGVVYGEEVWVDREDDMTWGKDFQCKIDLPFIYEQLLDIKNMLLEMQGKEKIRIRHAGFGVEFINQEERNEETNPIIDELNRIWPDTQQPLNAKEEEQ